MSAFHLNTCTDRYVTAYLLRQLHDHVCPVLPVKLNQNNQKTEDIPTKTNNI